MKEETLIRRTSDLNLAKAELQELGQAFTSKVMKEIFRKHRIPTNSKFIDAMLSTKLMDIDSNGLFIIPRIAPFCQDHIIKVFNKYLEKLDIEDDTEEIRAIELLQSKGYIIAKAINNNVYQII